LEKRERSDILFHRKGGERNSSSLPGEEKLIAMVRKRGEGEERAPPNFMGEERGGEEERKKVSLSLWRKGWKSCLNGGRKGGRSLTPAVGREGKKNLSSLPRKGTEARRRSGKREKAFISGKRERREKLLLYRRHFPKTQEKEEGITQKEKKKNSTLFPTILFRRGNNLGIPMSRGKGKGREEGAPP